MTGTRASTTDVPGMTPAGSRSFQELEKSARRVVRRQAAGQRGRQLVRVLAHAGARSQGGPIVEEDAHARAMLTPAVKGRQILVRSIA